MTQPATPQTAAWDALFKVHALAESHLNSALKNAGLPQPEACQLLLAVSNLTGSGKVTAKQMEQELQVPQYRMSRLLDRLEKQGFVEREPNPTDKRSSFIALTETGQQMSNLTADKMELAKNSFFANQIKPGQLDRLTTLLAPLLATKLDQ